MKKLKIEFTQKQIGKDALTVKKAYDVYEIDIAEGLFLIVNDNREFLWVDSMNCKQSF